MSSGGGAHGARVVEPADAAVLAFLDQLSPEDAARFFLLRRSAIPTETVATLIRPMLPPTIADDTVQSFVVAVSGAAKAFAVQLAEAARETAGDGAITGPRMIEAYRRIAAQGLVLGLSPEGTLRCGDTVDEDMLPAAQGARAPAPPTAPLVGDLGPQAAAASAAATELLQQ